MDLFADNGESSHSGGIKLFGVTLRKSASAGELCQNALPDQPQQFEGYATDGFGHNFSRSAPRKRGVPWTEEEHRLFLKGLEKLGKGDWRGISRLFVKSRTPTQVASHAQKFYLRQKHVSRKKRRSSLFDICHDHHKIQMEGSVHSMATPPVSWWCASPDMSWESISTSRANQTEQTIDENGCGLNLSIAPPSNVSVNLNSAIRVL